MLKTTEKTQIDYCDLCPFTKNCNIQTICKPVDYKKENLFAFNLQCILQRVKELSALEYDLNSHIEEKLKRRFLGNNLTCFYEALHNNLLASIKYDAYGSKNIFVHWVYKNYLDALEYAEISNYGDKDILKNILNIGNNGGDL